MDKYNRDLPGFTRQKAKSIFWVVFIFAFVIQLVKMTIFLTDNEMWANQIQYFLSDDPRVFDFHMAYGHPGTTLVGLGCIFHTFLGVSFINALSLSEAILISSVTALCSALCFLLHPQSLWWFTTGFILTLSRFYVTATPPTAAVMPFITLIVLATCWIARENVSVSGWLYLQWGIILGLSAATRLDISLFVGIPLFMLLTCRSGTLVIAPVLTGCMLSFFLADPFLWFMPVQHVTDLLYKFTLHYSTFGSSRQLPWFEWIHGLPLAVVAMGSFITLHLRRRLSNVISSQVLLVFLGISLLAGMLLATSRFQSIRYLYPLIIVWEIFLPLFLLGECPCANGQLSLNSGNLDVKTTRVIMGFVIPTQIFGYLFMFNT